jgi:hypothetical protein
VARLILVPEGDGQVRSPFESLLLASTASSARQLKGVADADCQEYAGEMNAR